MAPQNASIITSEHTRRKLGEWSTPTDEANEGEKLLRVSRRMVDSCVFRDHLNQVSG